MKTVLAVILILALSVAAHAAQTQRGAPLAIVTGVSGEVQVVPPGKSAGEPVTLGANLYENDELRLGKGAEATLLYDNGQIVEVSATEKPSFTLTRDSYRGPAVQRVAMGKSGQEAAGTIFETRSRGVNLGSLVYERVRGDEDEIQLVRPMDSAVLAQDPTFAWKAPAGFKGRLAVMDESGRKVVDLPVEGTCLSYKGTLPAGQTLTWTVAASDQAPPEDRIAEFRTLSAADTTALAAARADIEKSFPQGESRGLLLGLLYRKHGLYHDAIAALEPISSKHPANAFLHGELAWLYYQVGELDRSKSELERARADAD